MLVIVSYVTIFPFTNWNNVDRTIFQLLSKNNGDVGTRDFLQFFKKKNYRIEINSRINWTIVIIKEESDYLEVITRLSLTKLHFAFASYKIPQRPCYARNCHFVPSCFATTHRWHDTRSVIRCAAVASAFCIAVTWQAAWLNSLNCVWYAIPTRSWSIRQIPLLFCKYIYLFFNNSFTLRLFFRLL